MGMVAPNSLSDYGQQITYPVTGEGGKFAMVADVRLNGLGCGWLAHFLGLQWAGVRSKIARHNYGLGFMGPLTVPRHSPLPMGLGHRFK